MRSETFPAFAKINLTLDVLRRREDGYHDIATVMQCISLADRVTLTENESGQITCDCDLPHIPTDGRNLAVKAANAFFRAFPRHSVGVHISLAKMIPSSAGLAGGSSDAAAVLRGLAAWYSPDAPRAKLSELALSVGSDVPFCLIGQTSLCEGRGEIMRQVPPMPDCFLAVCKPDFPVSTAELYAAADSGKAAVRPDTAAMLTALAEGDIAAVARSLGNVFEDFLPDEQAKQVTRIKEKMRNCGALQAAMSGSGPTVFGIFTDRASAENAVSALAGEYKETFFAKPLTLV